MANTHLARRSAHRFRLQRGGGNFFRILSRAQGLAARSYRRAAVRVTRGKLQIPNSKAPNKDQAPNPKHGLSDRPFGVWDLGFFWDLGFGILDFGPLIRSRQPT